MCASETLPQAEEWGGDPLAMQTPCHIWSSGVALAPITHSANKCDEENDGNKRSTRKRDTQTRPLIESTSSRNGRKQCIKIKEGNLRGRCKRRWRPWTSGPSCCCCTHRVCAAADLLPSHNFFFSLVHSLFFLSSLDEGEKERKDACAHEPVFIYGRVRPNSFFL